VATVADTTSRAAEFRSLHDRLRKSVPWGPGDRQGALNYITPAMVVAAVSEVRAGRTASLAAPIEHSPAPDNPDPMVRELVEPAESVTPRNGLSFAADTLSLHVHGDADSHIDALCHVIFDGAMYDDVEARAVRSDGAGGLSIDVAAGQGIVGRGVLLDIPKARGIDWLEPGDHVTAADLIAAEDAEGVRAETGDLLFVRVGHRRRRRELGPWDAARQRAGLDLTAVELIAERQVAVLGSDGNNDTAPSTVPDVDFPVHVLAIRVLGVHLLDYLDFDDLVAVCEGETRWTFLCVIAPLRLPGGTGSPINPIAIF
jgi:kynurenine formamidase